MLKRLIPYMREYRWPAIVSPLFMALEAVTDIMVPYLMADIVDIGINQGDTDLVISRGILMLILALSGMFFGGVSSFAGSFAGQGFAANIRNDLYKKVQSFSFRHLDSFGVPTLITRLTNDTSMLGMVATMTLRMAVRAPMLLILALFMSIRINAQLTLLFAIAIPVLVILVALLMRKAGPLFKLMQSKVDNVNETIRENLTAIRVVKSFNRQEFEKSRFAVRNDELKDTAIKAIMLVISLFPAMNLIVYATIIAALWFGGNQIMGGNMETGQLISFVTYITQILMALMMMSFYMMQLTRGSASAQRVIEVLDTDPDITSPEDGLMTVPDGSVVFREVNFRYPSADGDSLVDINFSLKSGTILGIIGSTGSSKTTLVQLLPRLYDVTNGEIMVGGNNVRDYNLEVLRDEVAFVLQQNTLFTGTIRDNMQWGKPDASDEEIITALKHSEAWEFVSKYADGLDHPVEQGGSNFSGGQRQRLTIARALLKDPKIIILDDSTSAVDMETDRRIRATFKHELPDVTSIIIAQRVASIEHADVIMVMHEGKIETMGTHEELLDASVIYREIYESQQKGVLAG